MARKLRLQVAGGIYHLTSRGDRDEEIFRDDGDRESFLATLGEACGRTEWKVHAYCLLPNHFHLLIETPHRNLVSGMKWMLGTYTSRFNRRHGESGHVFAGRYRSQVIDPTGRYLSEVADYIHLNPDRLALTPAGARLETFRWSSWSAYVGDPASRPGWLQVDRVLGQVGWPDTAEGREAYRGSLEQRRMTSDAATWNWIRTGWYLGGESFRQGLLEEVATVAGGNHFGTEIHEAAEAKAGKIVDEELRRAVWNEAELIRRRKGDPVKIAIAHRLRRETTVTLQWIASRLHMGTRAHLSHLLYWDVRDRREAAAEGTVGDGLSSETNRPAENRSPGRPRRRAVRRSLPGPVTQAVAGQSVQDVSRPAQYPDQSPTPTPIPSSTPSIPRTDPIEFDPSFD